MSNCTIGHFAQTMRHSLNLLMERMKRDTVLQQFGRPYQQYVNRGYFAIMELPGKTFSVSLTGKGQIWLARKYPAGFDLVGGPR